MSTVAVRRLGRVLLWALAMLPAGTAGAGDFLLTTDPPAVDAVVLVDGASVTRTDGGGRAMLSGFEVGLHYVRVMADGRTGEASFYVEDAVTDGRVLVTMVAADASGGTLTGMVNVWISGNLAGVQVWADNQYLGETDGNGETLVVLPPGSHELTFSKAGYESQRMTRDLAAGVDDAVNFELQALGGLALGGGTTAVVVVVLLVAVLAATAVLLGVAWSRKGGRTSVTSIGTYRVKKTIGRGGMATIYLALDRARRAQVAMKVMDPGLRSDPDLLRKFLREGEILKELTSADPEAPLVQVYSFGMMKSSDGGVPYILMEYLDGINLLQHLKARRRLELGEASRLCAGVARALIPAHARGIYHRDLDPQNVILCDTPKSGYHLRLIDFGVARHEYTSHGTLDGSIAGKPPYMAPEQCRGDAVDGRADIYSLGIVFYTLLVGHPPFLSKNPLEVMRMHQEEEVPIPGDLPAPAASVLRSMLEKSPEDRPQSIAAVQQTYERLCSSGAGG